MLEKPGWTHPTVSPLTPSLFPFQREDIKEGIITLDASCQFSLNLFISFRIGSAGSDGKAGTPHTPHPTPHTYTQDQIASYCNNRSGKQTFPNPDDHVTFFFFSFFFGRFTSKFNLVFKACECKLGSPESAMLPSPLIALEDNGRQSSWINPNRMMQRTPPPLRKHFSCTARCSIAINRNQTCSRSVTSLFTCARTNVRFGLSLISGGIFRACLRKLKMCDMNQNMCAVFVPNEKKKRGVSPCPFVGTHTQVIWREREKELEKERERGRGEINSTWPSERGTVGV